MSAPENRAALSAYLQMLAGQRPRGRFIELRYLDSENPAGMSRRFFAAWDPRHHRAGGARARRRHRRLQRACCCATAAPAAATR